MANNPLRVRNVLFLALLVASATQAARGGKDRAVPELDFSADTETVTVGDRATLSWTSSHTQFCSASGDWKGKLPTEGTYQTPPLAVTSIYTLKCQAKGGAVEQSVTLAVVEPSSLPEPEPAPLPEAEPAPLPDAEPAPQPEPSPAPAPEPTLVFTAQSYVVDSESMVTLTWTADNTIECQAGGAWSGSRLSAGSEAVGPIYAATDYSLTCTGDGGSVARTLHIDSISTIYLTWVPPVQNVDGTPLTDLAGYRIYFGDGSRSYSTIIDVTDAAADTYSLRLASGSHYVAMTALDRDGNESAYSNEVIKIAP